MMKRIFLILQCMILCLSLLPVPQTSASYDNGYEGTMAGEGAGIFAYGVDLSEWQGHQVNFHKIKEQGCSFVILRAGFASTIDDCFEENYAKAKEAGLDVGVYLYSYADNTDEARQEAQAMLGWLTGKQLEYPVYYDLEDPKCHGNMSVDLLTEIAFTFLEILSGEGWLTGIYSCKSWLETKFHTETIGATYECWMAQFVSSGTYDIYDRYDEVYGMWQYSCTGTVAGVPGGVDMNVCFKDYPGICRQYGFNGYAASDESLLLRDVSVPSLLPLGENLDISGKVISNGGKLTNVTAGIYSLDGQVLTGRSVGPSGSRYDLSELVSGIKAQQLPEGSYLFRINASNSKESYLLLNQPLIISDSGVYLMDAVLPHDLKIGQSFSLSGTVLCAAEMEELILTLQDESGASVLTSRAAPNSDHYDLSELSADLGNLAMGAYRLRLDVRTANTRYTPLDEAFYVWAANDPIHIEKLQLENEYFPGEFTGLGGEIVSAVSALRQVDIEILDKSGALMNRVISQPGKVRVSLADYQQRLAIGDLPIGVYELRISALNDGGPAVLLEQRFLIREDSLGICDLVVPDTLYRKDSFSISGAVFSDVTMLEYVGASVTDEMGRELLSAAVIPNRNLLDLSALSDDLQFSMLDCGVYTLRIYGENEKGGAALYEGQFYVVEHSDVIYWEEPCLDPRGIAYSSATGYYLNGVLTSKESAIYSVSAEILLADGSVYSSAQLQGEGQSASLEKCNEILRFSALPDGEYILRISASNQSGSYEMLRAPFSVCQCYHSNVRSGQVIQPGCVSCGAVTDSRCLDCGEKVRNGFTMEPLGHQEENGSCIRCGKAGFIPVTAELTSELPHAHGRYVIAHREGDQWYALRWDGTTVPISTPDAQGRISLDAGFLWRFEPQRDGYCARNPFGNLLHFDSTGLKIAVGAENTVFTLTHSEKAFLLTLSSAENRALAFSDKAFVSAGEGEIFMLLRYIPGKIIR